LSCHFHEKCQARGANDEAPPIPVDAPAVKDPNKPEAPDLCTAIDVMVVWTPAARAAAGGTTAMQNLVNLAVVETNQSYVNSQMNQRIRLARSQEVSYTESGDFLTDLVRLAGTSDGYIDSVHTLRNTYYADLVSLFIEGTQYCGIGYLMETVSHSFESSAFTVVGRSCATGSYSFAHEWGTTKAPAMNGIPTPAPCPTSTPMAMSICPDAGAPSWPIITCVLIRAFIAPDYNTGQTQMLPTAGGQWADQ
jgi:hypothetical protein